MTSTARLFPAAIAIPVAVIGLPWLGAILAGHDASEFLHFPPPLEIPTDYLQFSWWATGTVILLLGAIASSWIFGSASVSRPARPLSRTQPLLMGSGFPLWGWLALAWTLAIWAVAWTRVPWLTWFQPYTFFPLWLGFIVTTNAWVHRRSGTCLMQRAPRRWIALFGASAVFWWLFEWLNRFVHNWHYLGVTTFEPAAYAFHATLCFSTVLPAVSAVAEGLDTCPRWTRRLETGPAWAWFAQRETAFAFLVLGGSALLLTGAFPRAFYPALWIAPLALFLGEASLRGQSTVAQEISAGYWRRAGNWMAAALICGFFWELWNWQSLTKWIYTGPGVDRWHLFEMPLLGYTGYLPFGLECLLAVERLRTFPSPALQSETPAL